MDLGERRQTHAEGRRSLDQGIAIDREDLAYTILHLHRCSD